MEEVLLSGTVFLAHAAPVFLELHSAKGFHFKVFFCFRYKEKQYLVLYLIRGLPLSLHFKVHFDWCGCLSVFFVVAE